MSESIEPTRRTAEAYEDVFDALKIAFWNDAFEDCESEALPTEEFDNETRSHCKIRRKTDFDTIHQCPVMITHYMFDSERNSVIKPHEFLNINWENKKRKNLVINILDFYLGYYQYDGDSDESVYVRTTAAQFESAKSMAKAALGAVSSL